MKLITNYPKRNKCTDNQLIQSRWRPPINKGEYRSRQEIRRTKRMRQKRTATITEIKQNDTEYQIAGKQAIEHQRYGSIRRHNRNQRTICKQKN